MKTLLLAVTVAMSAVACSSTSTTSTPPPVVASVTPTLPSSPASAQQCHERHGLPDRACTPGAINLSVTQASLTTTICKHGWTATVRPPESYTGPLKIRQISQYGYTDTNPASYEEDHLVPLELGGSPANPANLWPEPRTGTYGARAKDTVEDAARAAVCDGRQSLAAMQRGMEVDWEALGRVLAASTPTPVRTYTPAPARTYVPPPVRTHTTTPAHASCYPTTSTGAAPPTTGSQV